MQCSFCQTPQPKISATFSTTFFSEPNETPFSKNGCRHTVEPSKTPQAVLALPDRRQRLRGWASGDLYEPYSDLRGQGSYPSEEQVREVMNIKAVAMWSFEVFPVSNPQCRMPRISSISKLAFEWHWSLLMASVSLLL